MPDFRAPRYLALSAAFVTMFCTGCAAHVGRSIDVPEIPTAEAPQSARGKLNTSLSVAGFKDVRSSVAAEVNPDVRYTEPEGDVPAAVEEALARAFKEKGITVTGGAPVTVWGEVRRWRAQVDTTTVSTIQSEAALFVEVQDNTGKSLFSGTYHGSRTSQFPVSSPRDIKDSLGLAMSQAITQLLDDEMFINALWKSEGR